MNIEVIYKFNMFKYLIAVLLVTATVQQTLFLSPPFPPTGFYQQYYEVRFRVRGLNGPTFTFDNLPNFFTGSQDGVVSGTPNITGTFRFTVTYTDGTTSGSDKVVISVTASPNTAASASQSAAVNLLVIQVALDTWIYRSGDAINIQLTSQNGVSPITWNYKNLPAGLTADNNGKISGAISDSGLYSFSASCGDSKGLKAESYYTLNIQPGTVIKSNTFFIQQTTLLTFPTEMFPLSIILVKLQLNKLLLILPLLKLSVESVMPRSLFQHTKLIKPRLNLPSILPILKSKPLKSQLLRPKISTTMPRTVFTELKLS